MRHSTRKAKEEKEGKVKAAKEVTAVKEEREKVMANVGIGQGHPARECPFPGKPHGGVPANGAAAASKGKAKQRSKGDWEGKHGWKGKG